MQHPQLHQTLHTQHQPPPDHVIIHPYIRFSYTTDQIHSLALHTTSNNGVPDSSAAALRSRHPARASPGHGCRNPPHRHRRHMEQQIELDHDRTCMHCQASTCERAMRLIDTDRASTIQSTINSRSQNTPASATPSQQTATSKRPTTAPLQTVRCPAHAPEPWAIRKDSTDIPQHKTPNAQKP
jgi:hypothetical protein